LIHEGHEAHEAHFYMRLPTFVAFVRFVDSEELQPFIIRRLSLVAPRLRE
jgi:hypothetical protein